VRAALFAHALGAVAVLFAPRAVAAETAPKAETARQADAAPQAQATPKQSAGPHGGFFAYGAGLSLQMFDIPLLMAGGGIYAAVTPKGYPELRFEGGGELLLGKTEAGLEARHFAVQFGPDVALSVFHFAPTVRIGYFWLDRVSGTRASLGDPTLGAALRAGPELVVSGKNRLALDLMVHAELLGAPIFGYGVGLRYGYF
jgi:hypothetical protein